MIPFAAETVAETAHTFEWARQCPKKLSIPWGISNSILYMVPWANPTQPPKRHLNRFSRFCRAHERDRNIGTHTRTDQTRYSVSSNRPLSLSITAMRSDTDVGHLGLGDKLPGKRLSNWRSNSSQPRETRSSATAEGSRDALC